MEYTERPLGIKIVSIFWGAVGIFLILSSTFSINSALLMTVELAIIGVIGLLMAYGLWTAKKWGLWLGVLWPVLMILAIFGFNIIPLIIMVPNVYYLTRRNTKSFFGM